MSSPRTTYFTTEAERCAIIKAKMNNVPISTIARDFGVSRKTIYEILKAWDANRIAPLKHPGQKSKFKLAYEDKIRDHVTANPFDTNEQIISKLGLDCSRATVRRICKNLNLRPDVATPKPKSSSKNKTTRSNRQTKRNNTSKVTKSPSPQQQFTEEPISASSNSKQQQPATNNKSNTPSPTKPK